MKQLELDNHQITDQQRNQIRHEGYRVLVGCVCVHLVLGTFYLWGGISRWVASYLNQFDSTIKAQDLLGVFPYMALCMHFTTSLGVRLAQRIGHRLQVTIFMCCISATVFICSFIQSKNLFVVVYAGGCGFSTGLTYMLPLECAVKYFPNQKGRISGFIIGAFGLSSFIFNFLTLEIVNPDDLKPDPKTKLFGPEVYNNIPKMFRYLALCYIILGMAGVLLIRYPRDLHLELYEEHHVLTKEGQKKTQEQVIHNECGGFKQGVSSRPFIFLFFMALTAPYAGQMMANSYKTYGFDLGKSDSFLTLTGSLQSLTNGFSRPLWGTLSDKYGFKKVYIIILIGQACLLATLDIISSASDALYLIWVCLIMGLMGGQLAIFPAFHMKLFGVKIGPLVYGVVFIAIALANLNSYLLIQKEFESIGWNGLWWIAFGYTIIALILITLFKQEHTWPKSIDLNGIDQHHIAVHSDDDHHDDHHDDHFDHHDDEPKKPNKF